MYNGEIGYWQNGKQCGKYYERNGSSHIVQSGGVEVTIGRTFKVAFSLAMDMTNLAPSGVSSASIVIP